MRRYRDTICTAIMIPATVRQSCAIECREVSKSHSIRVVDDRPKTTRKYARDVKLLHEVSRRVRVYGTQKLVPQI